MLAIFALDTANDALLFIALLQNCCEHCRVEIGRLAIPEIRECNEFDVLINELSVLMREVTRTVQVILL